MSQDETIDINDFLIAEPQIRQCPVCERSFIPKKPSQHETIDLNKMWRWAACGRCTRKYPPALIKATADSFDYALKLRTGEVIFFHSAEIMGDYAVLDIANANHENDATTGPGVPILAPRGLDVRIRDIVWCADAPFDS